MYNEISSLTTRPKTASHINNKKIKLSSERANIQKKQQNYHHNKKLSQKATKSVPKCYKLSKMRPFSAQQSKYITDQQMKTNSYFRRKKTIQDDLLNRLNCLIKTAKTKRTKNKLNRKFFTRSNIQDDHINLVQDFYEDQTYDKIKKHTLLNNLNIKLKNAYPEYQPIDPMRKTAYPTQINLQQMQQQRKRVKKQYPSHLQIDINLKPKKYYGQIFDKNDRESFGTYCRSAKRTFRNSLRIQKQKQKKKYTAENSQRSMKNSKVYYNSFLGSYSQRKKVLISCKEVACENYQTFQNL